MYTIKQAALLTGIPESSLRSWERRYAVVEPHRNAAGYRLYDPEALAVLSAMRQLVDDGWSPAEAARAVRGRGEALPQPPADRVPQQHAEEDERPDHAIPPADALPPAMALMQQFLQGAAELDESLVEGALDQAFSLGSFEHVVDSWLFPTLEALGEAWAGGEIDVAGEHAASHAVHRRLSAAFDAAGSRARGPAVVVGLPAGSQHDLGALAFATAIRRRGLNVLYLGANVPVSSWDTAVRSHAARAAVLAVVTEQDRAEAVRVAERLRSEHPGLLVCSGGASGAGLLGCVRPLAAKIRIAAEELDDLLHADSA